VPHLHELESSIESDICLSWPLGVATVCKVAGLTVARPPQMVIGRRSSTQQVLLLGRLLDPRSQPRTMAWRYDELEVEV
jgi:hypothetical protein